MARIKGALATRKRRNKTLKLAKGYWGGKSRLFKTAKEAVWKSGQYAYISRRLKKRDFRKLWIARINAACKMNGTNYSTFINGLKKAISVLTERCCQKSLSTILQVLLHLLRRLRLLFKRKQHAHNKWACDFLYNGEEMRLCVGT